MSRFPYTNSKIPAYGRLPFTSTIKKIVAQTVALVCTTNVSMFPKGVASGAQSNNLHAK